MRSFFSPLIVNLTGGDSTVQGTISQNPKFLYRASFTKGGLQLETKGKGNVFNHHSTLTTLKGMMKREETSG